MRARQNCALQSRTCTVGTEAARIEAVSSVVTAEPILDCQQNDHDLDAKVAIGEDGA